MTKHQAIPRRPRLLSRGDGLSYQPTTFGLTPKTIQAIKAVSAEVSISTSAMVEILLADAIDSGSWERVVNKNKYVKRNDEKQDDSTDVYRPENPTVTATRARRKPAADAMIRLGDLFDDLPDDIEGAGTAILQRMTDRSQFTDLAIFELATRIYTRAYADVLDSAMALERDGGRGAVGPRLPDGVTFVSLLPHLSDARRIIESKDRDMPFDRWVKEHHWPGGITPGNTTVRKWCDRYALYIDEYEETHKDLAAMLLKLSAA